MPSSFPPHGPEKGQNPLSLSNPSSSTSSTSSNLNPISSEANRVLEYRNAANFRTVQRNDPSVVEILETSVYSTIYHYDEGMDKWAKQKQEGSLFVIKRDKAPEYALYMLNRITVKNVMIPLVPREMKVTIIDDSMMQVARRKEKIKYGIWFSEGLECMKRFRQTIVGICGEPAPRPPTTDQTPIITTTTTTTTAPNQPHPPHLAQVQSAPLAPTTSAPSSGPPPLDDGFSRLFAGLLNQPLPKPTLPPPAPMLARQDEQSVTQMATSTTTKTQRVIPAPPPPPPLTPSHGYHDPGIIPSSQPSTVSEALTPSLIPSVSSTNVNTNGVKSQPQLQHENTFAPGQTVDDLLMSLMGATPAPPPPPPVTAASHNGPGSPVAQRSTRVGEATFAQAAGRNPITLTSANASQMPGQQPHSSMPPQSSTNGPSPVPPSGSLSNGSGTSIPLHSSPLPPNRDGTPVGIHYTHYQAQALAQRHSQPHPHHQGLFPPLLPQFPIDGNAARNAVIDTALHHDQAIIGSGMTNGMVEDQSQKIAFINGLLKLIHTDDSFVDELWRNYLTRSDRAH